MTRMLRTTPGNNGGRAAALAVAWACANGGMGFCLDSFRSAPLSWFGAPPSRCCQVTGFSTTHSDAHESCRSRCRRKVLKSGNCVLEGVCGGGSGGPGKGLAASANAQIIDGGFLSWNIVGHCVRECSERSYSKHAIPPPPLSPNDRPYPFESLLYLSPFTSDRPLFSRSRHVNRLLLPSYTAAAAASRRCLRWRSGPTLAWPRVAAPVQ